MLITCVSGGYSIIVLAALVFDEDELTEGDEVAHRARALVGISSVLDSIPM